MAGTSKITGSVLLALATIAAQSGQAGAAMPGVQRPFIAESVITHVAMSVEEATARLQAAQQALKAAKAGGGDVKAAQAEVQAAKKALNQAKAAGGQEPQERKKPKPADAQQQPERKKPQPDDAAKPNREKPNREKPVESDAQQPDRKKPQPDETAKPNREKPNREKPVENDAQQPDRKKPQPDDAAKPNREKPSRDKPVEGDAQQPDRKKPTPDDAAKPNREKPNREKPVDGDAKQPDRKRPQVDGKPQPDNAGKRPQTDNTAAEGGDRPRPDARPRPTRADTPEERARKKKVAENPGQTDETVVLPVDRGAPVLDSDKNAGRRGQSDQDRRKRREDGAKRPVPKTDADAQRGENGRPRPPVRVERADRDNGQELRERPRYETRDNDRVERRVDNRLVIQFGDDIIVRGDDNDRFARYGRPPVYEQLPAGRVRETVFKTNGDRVVTIRNRYGDLIQRSRIDRRDREDILFFSPELYYADDAPRPVYRDPGLDLPPMRLQIPVRDYIIDTTSEPDRDYYDFIEQPPVEEVERVYTLEEVRNSARIRDKVRRIDLDTITFATGSADISMNQAGSLRKVADAINKSLAEDAGETFLIEGHTDAVGSDESNLVLSDLRAESVANVLTEAYGVPPENMVTQGYGEQFLKVDTDEAEQLNRRVTIRRVTALVRPVEAAQQQ
ncbi:OmpA family protein [Rhizobium sp. CG5]|uniref:OmpA family protein n=1 Tax=Rhizobium sp. CG5 TaxID=2726076 RepID=UPI00203409A3|nr:OmpA family protein [Rhizobium sp. CG5]MCM2475725.1 OmpA family protein [Rhizobium sp. CG5]